MSAETSVAIVFLVVLLVMIGAAYSYYLLEQDAKKAEEPKVGIAARQEESNDHS